MPNNYYKKSDIREGRYYKIPKYIERDFSDIRGREIIIVEGDRLDVIAHVETGDSKNWRALALYNNIGYFFDLTPGQVFRIPYDINEVLKRI